MMLTGKQRQRLKARAHTLKPVVQLGRAGLTDAVIAQIDEALRAHELIKVKLPKAELDPDGGTPELIRQRTASAVVSELGRVLLLFRRNPKKPQVTLRKADPGEQKTPRSQLGGRQLRRKKATSTRRTGTKAHSRPARRGKR